MRLTESMAEQSFLVTRKFTRISEIFNHTRDRSYWGIKTSGRKSFNEFWITEIRFLDGTYVH